MDDDLQNCQSLLAQANSLLSTYPDQVLYRFIKYIKLEDEITQSVNAVALIPAELNLESGDVDALFDSLLACSGVPDSLKRDLCFIQSD